MTDTLAEMRTRLSSLNPLSLDILDESAAHAGHAGARSGGGHYRMRIASASFEGLGTVARHRAVYTALGDLMQNAIHALTIVATSPSENTPESAP
jgi:BolA protein